MCKWRASVTIDVGAARHDLRVAAIHLDLDRVQAADARVGLTRFELVMSSERLRQALDGDVGKMKRLRIKAAGVAGHFSEPHFERVIVRLRKVQREDADARRRERLPRSAVHRRHPYASAAERTEPPSEEDQRL